MLELCDLDIGFGSFRLQASRLAFPPGLTIVTGPNGSGKSTLLNALALNLPNSGFKLNFNGKEIGGRSQETTAYRRKTAYCMQNPYLFNMSVSANIGLGMKLRRMPKSQRIQKALTLMEQFSIHHLAGRRISKLSGGETQRVALARILAMDAAIFLFDEPTAALDETQTTTAENLILDKARMTDKVVVMTSNSTEQIQRMGGRLIRIEDGMANMVG